MDSTVYLPNLYVDRINSGLHHLFQSN